MIGRIFSKILKSSDEAATKIEPALSMDDVLEGLPPEVPPSEPPLGGSPPEVPPSEPPSGGSPPAVPPSGEPPSGEPPFEGPPLVMPQTLGGSTRKLPNADYFTNPDTQELIRLTQRAQVLREGKSWKETKQAAKDVAAIKDLHGKPPNERWTASEVTALRQQLDTQARQIKTKADEFERQVSGGEPLSAPQVAEMQQLMDRLAATEDLISGAAHEAGQLLNALKIPIESDYAMARAIAKLASEGGGSSHMRHKVEAIAKAQDPQDVLKAAREGWLAKTWKGLMAYRYNMMLSSIRSHGANILGSATTGGYETLVIKNLAAVNSMLEGVVTGNRAVTFGDNWRGFQTSVQSTLDAFTLAKDIAAGRTTPEQSGKFLSELGMRVKPIRKMIDPADPSKGTHPLTAVEKARLIGGTPTRMLEAEDAFFRTIFNNQRLSEIASRRARMLHPTDANARNAEYDRLMTNPPEDMKEEALVYSQKLTFTNDPSVYGKVLGAVGKSMIRFQQDIPGMQLLMPFVRTPANIMSYSMEQMGMQQVLAPMRTWQAITGTDAAARADTLARIEAAVGIMALAGWMVNEGSLTGIGSTDFGMRRMYEAQGWKQNSLCLHGECYELSRLDPLGLMLGIAASGWEVSQEMGETGDAALAVMTGSLLSMTELMLDRSYLSSAGDFFNAINGGAKASKAFISTMTGIASSFAVPGIARDFREMTDEYRRDMSYPLTTGGMFNRILMQIKNGYPIASQGLANAVDVKGELIVNGGNFAVRGLLPMRVGNLDYDPVLHELMKNGMSIRKPKEFIPFPKGGGRLGLNLLNYDPSGRLYAEYQAYINQARYKGATLVTENAQYQRLEEMGLYGTPDSEAGKALLGAMLKLSSAAKLEFLIGLAEGELPSKLVPGENVPMVAPMVDIRADLAPLIMKMKRNEKIEFEQVPGLTIRPAGGKNIPKVLEAPEF